MLQIARFAMFGGRNMARTLEDCKRSGRGRADDRRIARGGRGVGVIQADGRNHYRTIEQILARTLV